MLNKLFRNKDNNKIVYAPIDGEVIRLEEVPDPVFAEKMMGDGVAILPTNGEVISPVDGKVNHVFPTKHAIGIQAENGAEILIHIGLETVSLNGEGFTTHVQEGASIKKGTKLISFDLDLISKKAKSIITPIVITNSNDMGFIKKIDKTLVKAGQDQIFSF